jgi:hypothetical protein
MLAAQLISTGMALSAVAMLEAITLTVLVPFVQAVLHSTGSSVLPLYTQYLAAILIPSTMVNHVFVWMDFTL